MIRLAAEARQINRRLIGARARVRRQARLLQPGPIGRLVAGVPFGAAGCGADALDQLANLLGHLGLLQRFAQLFQRRDVLGFQRLDVDGAIVGQV